MAAVAAAALLVDLVVWPAVAPFGTVPDTTLAVALALAMVGQKRTAVALALGAGLVCDLVGGYLVGLGAAARAAAVLVASFATGRTPAEEFWVTMVIAGTALVVGGATLQLGALAFGVPVVISLWNVARGVVFMLLTGALFAVAYAVFTWVHLEVRAGELVGRYRY